MATDPSTPRSRRALLGAAVGGAAAVVATSVRPLGARAADTETALIGVANTGTTETSFENTDAAEVSLAGIHSSDGTGVRGTSASGDAIVGQSATGGGLTGYSTDSTPSTYPAGSFRTGVYGSVGDTSAASNNTDETGVYGYSDVSYGSAGVWGESVGGIGVLGTGDWAVYGIAGAVGVVGDATPTGTGVVGFSGDGAAFPATLPAGVGVFAAAGSISQVALQVSGKVLFSRSGRKAIGKTATSVRVTLAGVTTASYVIATLQTSVSGCYVRAVVPASGSFTIYLSKAPGKTVYVGYMVIN